MDAEAIIERLGLQPLPVEGGFYRETYRSPESLPASALPQRYTMSKSVGTAIYYLLTPNTCSALHRLPTDEVYHFYLGDPVTMLQLRPDGTGAVTTLGSDVLGEHVVQCVVPRDTWQGCHLADGGRFALMGTTMAPGFDFSDFERGDRAQLIARYGEHADLITRLVPT